MLKKSWQLMMFHFCHRICLAEVGDGILPYRYRLASMAYCLGCLGVVHKGSNRSPYRQVVRTIPGIDPPKLVESMENLIAGKACAKEPI